MKGICVFLLSAAAGFAADFITGQAARAVIGQTTFTSADPNSSNTVIGAASGIAYANNTLFVVDDNRLGATPENNRVLIFQNLSSMLPAPTAQIPYNTACPVCVGNASVVLGQPDFTTTTVNFTASQSDLRQPTAVASDGVHLVVADTNHNRVLIWNRIPTANDTPADVVVGQTDFFSTGLCGQPTCNNNGPTASSLRGPQGVWIQNGKLYIADTQNSRVLIYNSIPTANGAAANVVVGAPNFTTAAQVNLDTQNPVMTASTFINPVSVTTDGVRLFVADVGANRVMIWNHIPTTNGTAADVEIGQPDMTTSIPNDAFTTYTDPSTSITTQIPILCTIPTGIDTNGNPTYPTVCNYTLNFPRFALSDGTHLFIADGGNDRVLEYYTIPTSNAPAADIILGQIGGDVDQAVDAVDSMVTPVALAWDGSNLYVSDPYNRRVMVYTPQDNRLPYQAVVNAATQQVIASGYVTISGNVKAGDIVSIAINNLKYTYTLKETDTYMDIVAGLVALINSGLSGDPNVTASVDAADSRVVLAAKQTGSLGDKVSYSVSTSSGASINASAQAAALEGGGSAAQVGPGTIVQINGTGLSAGSVSADQTQNTLPTILGGTQVYFNGIAAPLYSVSPTQIVAQVPWEFTDLLTSSTVASTTSSSSASSVNAYVRSVMSDGSIMATSAVALSIVPANPGIFYIPNTNPELAMAFHGSSSAVGLISVDGSVAAGDVVTATIGTLTYNYIVQSFDTLDSVRDAMVALLNTDPQVTARSADYFDRIILQARIQGPEGNSISYTASASAGASITITSFGSQMCCANVAGAAVTSQNPAEAGEIITMYATGLGVPASSPAYTPLIATGQMYPLGAPDTLPPTTVSGAQTFVSAICGGSTADVLAATLMQGSFATFSVVLHLNSGLTTNIYSLCTIAQGEYISNQAAIAVVGQQ
jgi:uncharacterized protein (TIGR03437 family)